MSTRLLMPFGGLAGETVFYDVGPTKKVISIVGGVTTETTQNKFPDYLTSAEFAGGTGNYLTVNHPTALNIGTSDFTVRFWIYPTTLTGSTRNMVVLQNNWDIYCDPDGTLHFYNGSSKLISSSGGLVTTGSWQHIELTRSSGTVYLFHNGVLIGSASQSTNLIGNIWYIGAYSSGANGFAGFMQDLHVDIGTALHTSGFTVPTQIAGLLSGTVEDSSMTDLERAVVGYLTSTKEPIFQMISKSDGTFRGFGELGVEHYVIALGNAGENPAIFDKVYPVAS